MKPIFVVILSLASALAAPPHSNVQFDRTGGRRSVEVVENRGLNNNDAGYEAEKKFIPITSIDHKISGSKAQEVHFTTANGISVSEITEDVDRPSSHQNERGEIVTSDTTLVKTGAISYTAPEGVVISLNYIADEYGYRPKGDHLPRVPQKLPEVVEAERQHLNAVKVISEQRGVPVQGLNQQQQQVVQVPVRPQNYQVQVPQQTFQVQPVQQRVQVQVPQQQPFIQVQAPQQSFQVQTQFPKQSFQVQAPQQSFQVQTQFPKQSFQVQAPQQSFQVQTQFPKQSFQVQAPKQTFVEIKAPQQSFQELNQQDNYQVQNQEGTSSVQVPQQSVLIQGAQQSFQVQPQKQSSYFEIKAPQQSYQVQNQQASYNFQAPEQTYQVQPPKQSFIGPQNSYQVQNQQQTYEIQNQAGSYQVQPQAQQSFQVLPAIVQPAIRPQVFQETTQAPVTTTTTARTTTRRPYTTTTTTYRPPVKSFVESSKLTSTPNFVVQTSLPNYSVTASQQPLNSQYFIDSSKFQGNQVNPQYILVDSSVNGAQSSSQLQNPFVFIDSSKQTNPNNGQVYLVDSAKSYSNAPLVFQQHYSTPAVSQANLNSPYILIDSSKSSFSSPQSLILNSNAAKSTTFSSGKQVQPFIQLSQPAPTFQLVSSQQQVALPGQHSTADHIIYQQVIPPQK